MRLEILEDKILVWQTGSKDNRIEYDSSEDKLKYDRHTLSYVKRFLLEEGQKDEFLKISEFMGKTLCYKDIPEVIPTGNYVVNQPIPYLVDKINDWIKEDGLDLDPDFQRGHVWDLDKRIKYIEFLAQGGVTPPIYFNHQGWMKDWKGDFVIVDGKQRLTSILMFMDNQFTIFRDLDDEGIGFYARELDYVPWDIKIGVNNLPTREKVLQWYLEMNSGNIQHTDEELARVKQLLEEETK